MKVGHRTDPGRMRPNNEDCLFVDPAHGLFIIADGMGGTAGGEVASFTAVQVVSQLILEHLPAGDATEAVYAVLMDALLEAHETICQRMEDQKELTGMGTTVVVALLVGAKLYVGHVGDSRAYLLHAAGLHQLTDDHSIVARILKKGMITATEARTHRLRHVLSQALGCAPFLVPSLQALDVRKGDVLLMCTDGLTDTVPDVDILASLQRHPIDPQAACDELVYLANERGGSDNVSLIIALRE